MKKLSLVFIVVLVIALAFTGCSKKEKAVGAEEKPPIELSMSYYKQEITDSLPILLDAFSAKYPNVTIVTEIHPNDGGATNAAAAAAGTLPDIMQQPGWSAIIENAKNGYILDLSGQPIMSQVIDAALPAVTYNGKKYAVPMDFAGIGIIYNIDIFNKYGLKPPTTYLELQQAAATLKENGVTPFAGLLKENWSIGHFLSMLHGSMLGAKVGGGGVAEFAAKMNTGDADWGAVVDTQKMFRIIDWYVANMDESAFEMNWDEQQAAFAQEKAAMMVQGLWSYGAAIGTNPALNCGFIPFPWSNKAAENKFFADVDSTFTLSAQSSPEEQEGALLFVNWLNAPEAVKIWTEDIKLTSTFKGADLSGMQKPFQDLMTSSATGAYPWEFQLCPTPTWEQATKNGAHSYVLGTASAEEVVAGINESWVKNYVP